MTKTEQFLELDIKIEQDIEAYKSNFSQGSSFIYAKILKRIRRALKAEREGLTSVRKRKEVIRDIHEDIDNFSKEMVESTRKELNSFMSVYYDKIKNATTEAGEDSDLKESPAFDNKFIDTPVALNDGRAVSVLSMLGVLNRIMKEDTVNLVNRASLPNETNQQIMQYVDNSGSRVRNQIDIFGATAVAIVASIVKARFFSDNKNLFRGHQHVSILDGATSDICIYRAGKTWFYDDEEGSTLPDPEIPPLHFKCRSFIVPIFKGENAVTEPTYSEWLERQPVNVQREVLGPARFAMYKSGDVTIGQMFESPGRRLTLKELRQAS